MSMLFKRIKDWSTSITAFRTGDVIPVDGPSGTTKIEALKLLKNASAYFSKNIQVDYVRGTIDTDNGTNNNYAPTAPMSLRSNFIESSENLLVVPPSGYFVRAIVYYNSISYPPGGSAFDSSDAFDYDKNSLGVYAGGKSNYYRILLKTIDGSDSDVSDSEGTNYIIKDTYNFQLMSIIGNLSNFDDFMYSTYKTTFVQGSIDINTGGNSVWPWSLRSNFIPKSEASVIIPPSGYYVRGLIYYSADTYPTGPDTFVSSQVFEYNEKSNFEVAKKEESNYYRIVLNRIDGSETDVSDADGIVLISVSSLAGQLFDLCKKVASTTYGMKLVVTGDSIPHGQVMDGTPPSSPYPRLVASALGMSLKNYAIGGSTFAQSSNFGGLYADYATFVADGNKDTSKIYVVMTGNQTYQDYSFQNGAWSTTSTAVRTPISARYQLMDDDADIVLVAAGTNDFQYNWTSLGTMADRTPSTFYGALHYTILGLLDKYLGKQIIFCTPIKRCQSPYTSVDSVNANGKTLEEYGQIIKEVCAYYSIPVIDLYAESGLNPQVASQSSLFDSYKTHPFQKGHDMIARVVSGKIKSFRGSVS